MMNRTCLLCPMKSSAVHAPYTARPAMRCPVVSIVRPARITLAVHLQPRLPLQLYPERYFQLNVLCFVLILS